MRPSNTSWRTRLHTVIFEADTPAGKRFDVALLWAIVLSVLVVLVESVASVRAALEWELHLLELVFTGLFTVEYILRLVSVKRPLRYAFSFYGLVDLLSILPTFVGNPVAGGSKPPSRAHASVASRVQGAQACRVLREAQILKDALWASRRKIIVFLSAVLVLVTLLGTVVYIIEDAEAGFTSIPMSIYWAIVTVTTVGYGDIAPQTVLGQMLASLMMILGYAIIAVPTGIVGAELARTDPVDTNTQACPGCGAEGHDDDAVHCKHCGHKL